MFKILNGNSLEVLKTLEAESIDCVMTSPPYFGLRDYGGPEQIWPDGWRGHLGLEPHFNLYISHLIQIFDEVKRVLKKHGTCWVNLGDSFIGGGGQGTEHSFRRAAQKNTGSQPNYSPKSRYRGVMGKSLCNIPSRFAIAMTDTLGFIQRNEIIWKKPNCMPVSCNDRFTVDFEKIYFFTKSRKYYFEQQFEPIKQCSIDRLQRAVSNKHKYTHGAKGQSEQGLHKARPYKGGGGKGKEQNCAISNNVFGGGDYLVASFDPVRGRNMRCVWAIPTQPYLGKHYAVYPEALCERPIKAGCPVGGTVLDPFCGHGTTGRVAVRLGLKFIGIDVVPENCEAAKERIALPLFSQKGIVNEAKTSNA